MEGSSGSELEEKAKRLSEKRSLSRSCSTLQQTQAALAANKFLLRVGVHSIQGRRKEQEDAHTTSLRKVDSMASMEQNGDGPEHVVLAGEEEEQSCFDLVAVFDGHGGALAAEFCSIRIPALLKTQELLRVDTKAALEQAIARCEEEFLDMARRQDLLDGTTACIVVIMEDGLMLHANVGDSEAVLCRMKEAGSQDGDVGVVEALPLSEVHNPAKNDAEVARIRMEGGKLVGARLCHPVLSPLFCSIAVSRSLGDLLFKG